MRPRLATMFSYRECNFLHMRAFRNGKLFGMCFILRLFWSWAGLGQESPERGMKESGSELVLAEGVSWLVLRWWRVPGGYGEGEDGGKEGEDHAGHDCLLMILC